MLEALLVRKLGIYYLYVTVEGQALLGGVPKVNLFQEGELVQA
jgi:hypothetical protein